MRRVKMARAPSGGAAYEIGAIEERIALAEWLLYEGKPDEAALALDGLLWRMARLVSDEYGAPDDLFILPGVAEPVILDDEEARLLIRLRLAAQAPNVEARLAHYAALARELREMRRAPHARMCPARRVKVRQRRQVRRDKYDGNRESA
jgi:hypothetical protein